MPCLRNVVGDAGRKRHSGVVGLRSLLADRTDFAERNSLTGRIGNDVRARVRDRWFGYDRQPLPAARPSISPIPFGPGSLFGDYEIIEEIARGGMGVVFQARQLSLNRLVALKMILASRLASSDDVIRFRIEAEAAARLNHPGIVPIYEVGELEGQHFFSMGLVEGGNLKKLTTNGPLPPKEAARIVKSIAEAVQYAHSRNIVHRDLKPANVLLDDEGCPKITDIGLAKMVEADSGITATGQVMGTPSYMAPEQAAGNIEVGPLADVYALGTILYYLLTGRAPFRGATAIETVRQLLNEEASSPRQINSCVDLDAATICMKCLEKKPCARYASAAQLAEELGRYLAGEPILARPVTRRERFARWVARKPAIAAVWGLVTLTLVLGSLGGVAIRQWRQAESARVAERQLRRQVDRTEAAELGVGDLLSGAAPLFLGGKTVAPAHDLALISRFAF